jgi:transcription antitermination factor NusG
LRRNQEKMAADKTKKTWYALYTKPRWEKKVHQLMEEKGIESYCPLNKVQKKWSDRYKIIEEPLFRSYVFVHVNEEQRKVVRFVDGVVNFVYWLGKPAVVKADEIATIKRFLNEYEQVQVESMEKLATGDKVKITSGVFMDHTGRVVANRNKTVILEIESLGCRLVAQLPREQVLPINRNKI